MLSGSTRAVIVGYDLDADRIYLHSGPEKAMPMGFETFERTWGRGGYWAMVVTTPQRIPAAATQRDAGTSERGILGVEVARVESTLLPSCDRGHSGKCRPVRQRRVGIRVVLALDLERTLRLSRHRGRCRRWTR